jgi:hypothetical protein
MKQIKAIKKIEQGNLNDLLALFSLFQGKEVQITIESIDSDELDEEVFKKAGIQNFLKDDDEADSIYDEKYRKLIA